MNPMPQPVCLPQTETWTLESADGRAYGVLIGEPTGPAPAGGYPVIYLLDARTCFGTMLESIRARCRRPDATGVGPAIAVGIVHQAEGPDLTARRTHDFTLGECAEPSNRDAAVGHPEGSPGGALAFMNFLETRVKPAVERRFPVNPARQTLFGHSLGGYFVLQALVSHPASYDSFVAVSPSIWWDRERLFREAAQVFGDAEDAVGLAPSVLLYTGEYEEKLAPWQIGTEAGARALPRRERRAMIRNAESFAAHLREISGGKLQASHQCFPGEDHASVLSAAINSALRILLTPFFANADQIGTI